MPQISFFSLLCLLAVSNKLFPFYETCHSINRWNKLTGELAAVLAVPIHRRSGLRQPLLQLARACSRRQRWWNCSRSVRRVSSRVGGSGSLIFAWPRMENKGGQKSDWTLQTITDLFLLRETQLCMLIVCRFQQRPAVRSLLKFTQSRAIFNIALDFAAKCWPHWGGREEKGGGKPPTILWSYHTCSSWTYKGQIQLTFHVMGDRGINRTISKNCLVYGLQSRTRVSVPTSGPPARRRPRTPRTVSPASGTTFCWSHWRETTFSEPPTCTAGKSSYVRWVGCAVHVSYLMFTRR